MPVGLDHERNTRSLDRDLDLVEPDLVEIRHFDLSGFHHGLGGDLAAVLLIEPFVEGATVDPDPDGNATVLGLARNQAEVIGLFDIPRVQPETMDTSIERRQGHSVAVVDVGHDGHRGARHDMGQPGRGISVVTRTADDVGPGTREGVDLLEGPLNVSRLGRGHRLNRDRRLSADGNRVRRMSQHYLARVPSPGDGSRAVVQDETSGLAISRYKLDMKRKASPTTTTYVSGRSLATSVK